MTRARRTAIVLIALVVVPFVVLASGAIWFWWQLDPPGGPGKRVEVQIERGWGVPRIGDELNATAVGIVDVAILRRLRRPIAKAATAATKVFCS